MSVYNGYDGNANKTWPTYVSEDGNVYTTPWEARSATNRYRRQKDLVNEQKRANEIAEKQLQNQKEMQERQLQHEADMKQQEAVIELLKIQQQSELMEQELENQLIQRRKELCDKYDVDYNDIEKFVCILNLGDQATIYKLQEELDQHKIYEQQKERIDELNEQIDDLKLRKAMKQPTNLPQSTTTQLICYILIFFAIVFGIPAALMSGVIDMIPFIIVDIIACIGLYFISKVSQANELRKVNSQLKKQSDKLEEEIQEYEQQKQIEHLPENIEELILANEQRLIDLGNKSAEEAKVKKQKFNEFRKTHYNDEMEKLLRKLEIEGLETIREKDATKKGTKKDYIRYMEQYL